MGQCFAPRRISRADFARKDIRKSFFISSGLISIFCRRHDERIGRRYFTTHSKARMPELLIGHDCKAGQWHGVTSRFLPRRGDIYLLLLCAYCKAFHYDKDVQKGQRA